MKTEKKIDRRVMYTKMLLRESLLVLMKEKSISKITPTELCRHANMNRNTFYTHYNSPEALLKSIEDEFLEQVHHSIEHSLESGHISEMMTEICQAIYDNRDLCAVLFTEFGNKDFLRRIIYLAYDKTVAEWKAAGIKNDNGEIDMLYCFTANGSVSVIQKWIQDGMILSPYEIAKFIDKISNFGLHRYMEK